MKNRILILFFACFFMIVSFAYADIGGGILLPIVTGKSGTELCTITVPEKYLDEKGRLIPFLEIVIRNQNSKMPIYAEYSDDLTVSLPSHLSGTYLIEIKIGDMIVFNKIHV